METLKYIFTNKTKNDYKTFLIIACVIIKKKMEALIQKKVLALVSK